MNLARLILARLGPDTAARPAPLRPPAAWPRTPAREVARASAGLPRGSAGVVRLDAFRRPNR